MNHSIPTRAESSTSVKGSTTDMMPPPRTPRKASWKENDREIPSSQSPPDTPLSSRSRTTGELSLSPLKELSTNIKSRYGSRTRRNGDENVPKLEVQDTFDASLSSDIGAEASVPRSMNLVDAPSLRLGKEVVNVKMEMPRSASTSPVAGSSLSHKGTPTRAPTQVQTQKQYRSPTRQLGSVTVKDELLDYGEDSDEDLGNQFCTESTQNVHKLSDSMVDDSGLYGVEKRSSHEEKEIEVSPRRSEPIEPRNRHHVSYEPPTQLSSTTAGSDDDVALQSENDQRLLSSPVFNLNSPQFQSRDSCQTPTQLSAGYARPENGFVPMLETESQYENAWHPLSLQDLGPHQVVIDLTSSPLNTPSATTGLGKASVLQVDVNNNVNSQLMHHNSSSHQPGSSPSRRKTQSLGSPELPSLPLPKTAISPTRPRSGLPIWHFQPMTESQMLPDSVMNFRTPTPPKWPSP